MHRTSPSFFPYVTVITKYAAVVYKLYTITEYMEYKKKLESFAGTSSDKYYKVDQYN